MSGNFFRTTCYLRIHQFSWISNTEFTPRFQYEKKNVINFPNHNFPLIFRGCNSYSLRLRLAICARALYNAFRNEAFPCVIPLYLIEIWATCVSDFHPFEFQAFLGRWLVWNTQVGLARLALLLNVTRTTCITIELLYFILDCWEVCLNSLKRIVFHIKREKFVCFVSIDNLIIFKCVWMLIKNGTI